MGLVAVQVEKASELVGRKSRGNESCGGGQRQREELKQKGGAIAGVAHWEPHAGQTVVSNRG